MNDIDEVNEMFWEICVEFKAQTNIKNGYLEYIAALLYIIYYKEFNNEILKNLYEKRKNYYIADYIEKYMENIRKENNYLFCNIKFNEIHIYRELGEQNILSIVIEKLYKLITNLEGKQKDSKKYIAKAYEKALINVISRREVGDSVGEIYTPTGIAKTMIGLVLDYPGGIVNDPSCGLGNIILNVPEGKYEIYGEEKNLDAYNLCMTNLMLHNVENKNIMYSPIESWEITKTIQEKYDAIISNPPFVDRNRFMHARRNVDNIVAPGDYDHIVKMLRTLKENGKMAVILPHGALFRTIERRIRIELIRHNYIDAIIGLPENIFFGTRNSVIIMVLSKRKKDTDILFIDASKEFVSKRKINVLETENQNKIIETYYKKAEIEEFSHVASIGEIQKNEYNLTIKRYIKKKLKKIECDTNEIVRKIDSLEREKDILEENIKDVLEKLEVKNVFKKYKKGNELNDVDYEEIGKNIRKALIESNLSMYDLSKKLEISPLYLSRVERGVSKIKLDELVRICQYLNISIEDVLKF